MLEICSHHSTYRALSKSLVIILSKKDLVEVLSNSKAIESGNRQDFLTKCQFLSELSFNRVLEFNNILHEQRFYPGDIVYDQDTETNCFYIVKRGRATIRTIVDIESENKFPSNNKWKVIKTMKKCMYKVRDLMPGEIFGHEELVEHFKNVQKT